MADPEFPRRGPQPLNLLTSVSRLILAFSDISQQQIGRRGESFAAKRTKLMCTL